MRTKQALKNTLSGLLLQAVVALSGLIIPRFFTELYGSAVNGLVLSINQFISYLGLVEAGVSASATVALYLPLANGDDNEVNSVLSAAKTFYMRSGAIFAGLVGLLILFYPMAVKNEITDDSFIRVMILVLSISGLVDYFYLGKYRVLLQADQKSYVISVAQIVGTVVMTIVSLLLIEWKFSAIAVKTSVAVIYLLRSLAVGLYVRRNYPQYHFRGKGNTRALNQRWSALVHQIAGMICNNTDVILLTLLLPTGALAEVSVYGTYNLVAYALICLMNAFSNSLSAGFGQLMALGDEPALERSFQNYEYMFFGLVFTVYSCMAALMYPFIGLYTATYADASIYSRWPLVFLFSAVGLLQGIRMPGLTMICAAGHYSQTRKQAILEAAINLAVSLLLIGRFGIYGVLLGTAASYLYRSADIIFYSARNFLPGSLKLTLRRLLRNTVTMVCITYAGIRLLPAHMESWLLWFLWAILFGLCACAAMVAVNLVAEPKEFKDCLSRILGMLHRG